ncbi:MAG TPA: hypothetical protein VMS22_10535 [Candidatus Eisenbacteria bacterium]|nr:hypothetical protein [Candidatus Eisenbacteria bacterium]
MTDLLAAGRTWGSTPAERAVPFPCDRHLAAGDAWFRARDVAAPAPVVFRRSPRALTPGLERLEVGLRVM